MSIFADFVLLSLAEKEVARVRNHHCLLTWAIARTCTYLPRRASQCPELTGADQT